MDFEIIKPADIEKRSFAIITEELGDRVFPEEIGLVVKRVIHTSADFDYADNLVFSEGAVPRALEAIRNGAHIVTDTNMVKAGINKKTLAKFGGEVHCFVADADVAEEAKQRGVTRSTVSMERAAKLDVPVIFAIGNAPTALIELDRLMREQDLKPELIIGVPVGCGGVQRADFAVAGAAYRCARTQGRQQCRGGDCQCAAVPARASGGLLSVIRR